MPTLSRTAACSATVPEYDTGMFQPPNSAKVAPSAA